MCRLYSCDSARRVAAISSSQSARILRTERASTTRADARQEFRLSLWIVHWATERRLGGTRLPCKVRALLQELQQLTIDAINLTTNLSETGGRITAHFVASARSSAMSATARS